MEYTNIKMDKENGVAAIRLNRPDALNALNPDLISELSHALTMVGQDQEVKALVLRGEGRAFCAGVDLIYFETIFAQPVLIPPFLQKINDCLMQIESLPVPVIAVVHGFALGRWAGIDDGL